VAFSRTVAKSVSDLTSQEFYQVSADHPLAKIPEIHRMLYIKIEFLEPCTAVTRAKEINKESDRRLKEGLPLSNEGQALLALGIAGYAHNKAKTESEKKDAQEVYAEFKTLCTENGIDSNQFVIDLNIPRFKCDYRNKVFASFYSAKGSEIETRGEYPIAYWTDSNQTKRKIEMLPGETTYVTMYIPKEVKSWEIWVPK